MKFLILAQYFPPEIGAAQTRLPAIAAELRRLGHTVEVVTSLPSYPKGEIFPEYKGNFYVRELRDGCVVHRVWIYAALGRGFQRVLNYGSFAVASMAGLLRANRPDYLFLESPPLFLAVSAVLASRIWGIPLIMNVADIWPDAIIEAGILRKGLLVEILLRLERWSYRKATFISAVTEGIRDCLLQEKSVPLNKVLFLPNGVDPDRFVPRPSDGALKERLGLAGKNVILWAGTLGQSHALEHVVEAANLLRDQNEIHFLFVGDGTARSTLVHMRNAMNLTNVSFHDPVPPDELPQFFSISECGLASLRDIPIHRGARPSKIFPIMASGKPIVFVGRGECGRLIEQAHAGITVPPGDPKALAHCLTNFLAQAQLAAEMGRNGRRFVEENYSWSKLVEDWTVQLQRLHPDKALAANGNRKTATIAN